MGRALLIVDVQKDFCEGGSLEVTGGDKVALGISDVLVNHGDRYALIVASRDWHLPEDDNDGHFGSPPDYLDSWPPHCVMGTTGAEFNAGLVLPPRAVEVRKGMGRPAYSAFQGRAHDPSAPAEPPLEALLSYHDIRQVDVVGLALDHCVKATAIDSARCGYRTTVFPALCASVNPTNDPKTVHELIINNVTVAGVRNP